MKVNVQNIRLYLAYQIEVRWILLRRQPLPKLQKRPWLSWLSYVDCFPSYSKVIFTFFQLHTYFASIIICSYFVNVKLPCNLKYIFHCQFVSYSAALNDFALKVSIFQTFVRRSVQRNCDANKDDDDVRPAWQETNLVIPLLKTKADSYTIILIWQSCIFYIKFSTPSMFIIVLLVYPRHRFLLPLCLTFSRADTAPRHSILSRFLAESQL